MRILGIDYGSKRVGIAVSDEGRQFALPKIVLANNKDLLPTIIEFCRTEHISEVVVGESKNYAGEHNEIMKRIIPFVDELKIKTGLPVHMEPEFMTSVAAARFQGKNEFHDASAAALILQSYLDTLHSKHV